MESAPEEEPAAEGWPGEDKEDEGWVRNVGGPAHEQWRGAARLLQQASRTGR